MDCNHGFESCDLTEFFWWDISNSCPLLASIEGKQGMLIRVDDKKYNGVVFYHPGFPNGYLFVHHQDFMTLVPYQNGIERFHSIPFMLS